MLILKYQFFKMYILSFKTGIKVVISLGKIHPLILHIFKIIRHITSIIKLGNSYFVSPHIPLKYQSVFISLLSLSNDTFLSKTSSLLCLRHSTSENLFMTELP